MEQEGFRNNQGPQQPQLKWWHWVILAVFIFAIIISLFF